MPHAIEYRRVRAPREHGAALIDPPLSASDDIITRNRRLAESTSGHWLNDLRAAARKELFAAALEHSRSVLGAGFRLPAYLSHPQATFILAGHQPELFHPGVWLKNFVLSRLGEQHQATAINLIVDNDKAHAPSVRVPTLIDGAPVAEPISFDDAATERPYEERLILNQHRFEDFAKRLDPDAARLVTLLWKHAQQGSLNLGLRLASARHRLEAEHGLRTLEVPLSAVCDTPSFARFALALLCDLPRLSEIYNAALADYRRINGVRSEAHPVPQLAREGHTLEAPFWIWSSAAPQRRAAFVQTAREGLRVTDGQALHVDLPLDRGQANDETLLAWRAAREQGIKIRPRALVTTMYARLVLSDLFLHGIGGAKYDQLTDAILSQFFEFEPPTFMTVTATLRLFPSDASITEARLRDVDHVLRELPYHPETIACSEPRFLALREEKRALVLDPPPQGRRKVWHDRITALNAQLEPYTHEMAARYAQERAQLRAQLQHETVFGSREFSFCLFGPQLIGELMQLAQ